MRKIIPFKKEILFKTKLKEVTSISLEHDYKVNDDLISGEFLVSGDYKITASSVNREAFSYQIPFEIALDSRYDTETINLDIENFYYEIINDEILKVNIDVYIEGEYKKIEELAKEIPKDKSQEEILVESSDDRNEKVEEPKEFEEIKKEEINIEEERRKKENNNDIDINIENINKNTNKNTNDNINMNTNDTANNKVNLFDNVSMEDTYSTYYVYIVKEEDTLDTILSKYGINKEDLEKYNDLSDIKPFDKIIIPSHNE